MSPTSVPDPAIATRLAALTDRLPTTGVDALLVSNLSNIRWATGFTGSSAWLVVRPGSSTVVTDGRYGEQATAQLSAAGVSAAVVVAPTGGSLLDAVASSLDGCRVVGFEAAHLSVLQHEQLTKAITSRGADLRLRPLVGVVESARRTKSPAEIESMARACAVADRALAAVVPSMVGLTEIEVRNRLEATMRELGASGPSYETIVATGPVNGARPHHRPTDTVIEAGHLVVIDVGALVDGYHSDMTRTFVAGEPTASQFEMYQLVLSAQMAGLRAVRAGVSAREVDAACRGVISDAGYGDWFSHGTGHGVGLEIHEEPFVSKASDAILQVGDVVTVEPGVYRGGFGGIRVEDLVVVTDDGCRILTASAKDSPCLPSPPTT